MASTASPILMPRERLVAFPPEPSRGRALYHEVKRRIIDSFREVAAASRGAADFDEARLSASLDQAGRAEHVSARLFAIYYDLLSAIDSDNIGAASTMFQELSSSSWACGAAEYHNLSEQDLGAGMPARFGRLLDSDPSNPIDMAALDARELERIIGLAREALVLLDAGAPEVSGEIRALVSEILFATGAPGKGIVFHGVSSFLLWGALFCNARGHQTVIELVQTLAHESSHLHLFGVALDEPLVLNPDEERHASPLRRDPRPMDGVYHATYVAARMHYALARLVASPVLDAAQREEAEAALRDHADTFRKGLETIGAHGRLTALGGELLSSAKEYMAG